MKNKFKIDDKVRIAHPLLDEHSRDESLPIGSICTVVDISDDGGVRLEGGGGWWYHKDELEYAENALRRLKRRYETKV